MNPSQNDYKEILTEIIKKQTIILGPQMAILKAKSVGGISLDEEGNVQSVDGDPQEILQKVINQYVALSGEIVKNTVNSVFAKYPSLKQ